MDLEARNAYGEKGKDADRRDEHEEQNWSTE